ncbi:MAG: nitronate monooxygenase, partial [Syntrophomonadaceae bacterium]
GGHLGFRPQDIDNPKYALENLVPEVVADLKPFEEKSNRSIPVIAAGGVFSGADIFKFISLGAAGVQMATRFVTTHECDASVKFKEAYVASSPEDTVIIKSPVGMPGRALRNEFIADVESGKKKPFKCPYHCISTCELEKSPYCIAVALMNAQKGNLRHALEFAGSNAYRCKEIISVKELMATLVAEYEQAAEQALT